MKKLLTVISLVVFLASCKKDTSETPTPAPTVTEWNVALDFKVDNASLQYDTIIYANDAGNNYSVSTLKFYLSGFEFEDATGHSYESDSVFYVDARSGMHTKFNFKNIPYGNYTRVKFYIGLDSTNNVTNALPNTVENQQMAWPDFMGGGYHFMKFEGYFIYNTSNWGFANHLGKNQNLVTLNLTSNYNVTASNDTLRLTMNLNEWFRNPNVYDLNVWNYSMSNDTAMAQLSANGTDVFTIK